MTVYVDELRRYPNGEWAHMMTDSDDLTELHALARRIGLRRSWFQDHPLHPHYDLRPSKRRAAIRAGAVPLSNAEFIKRTSKLYKDAK